MSGKLGGVFSRHVLGRVLLPPPTILDSKRILITADLGELWHERPLQEFMTRLAPFKVPLTLFCSNEFLDGRKGYPVIRRIQALARRRKLDLEIASHSVRHVSLSVQDGDGAAAVIKRSILSFRKEGFPVKGFRAPYLSIEGFYPQVLKAVSREKGILSYDSSTLYERNLLVSRVHDFLRWKSPHRVGTIWELPLSCLDDYHLFDKLALDDDFALKYWTRKSQAGLRRFNYFHLLVHPEIISRHLPAFEGLVRDCLDRYGRDSFATCGRLAAELTARIGGRTPR